MIPSPSSANDQDFKDQASYLRAADAGKFPDLLTPSIIHLEHWGIPFQNLSDFELECPSPFRGSELVWRISYRSDNYRVKFSCGTKIPIHANVWEITRENFIRVSSLDGKTVVLDGTFNPKSGVMEMSIWPTHKRVPVDEPATVTIRPAMNTLWLECDCYSKSHCDHIDEFLVNRGDLPTLVRVRSDKQRPWPKINRFECTLARGKVPLTLSLECLDGKEIFGDGYPYETALRMRWRDFSLWIEDDLGAIDLLSQIVYVVGQSTWYKTFEKMYQTRHVPQDFICPNPNHRLKHNYRIVSRIEGFYKTNEPGDLQAEVFMNAFHAVFDHNCSGCLAWESPEQKQERLQRDAAEQFNMF